MDSPERPTPLLPVACTLTATPGAFAERMAEYQRLFQEYLTGRSRTGPGIRFRFRAEPGVEDWVRDLARREKECCGFFDFTVSTGGQEIRWDAAVAGRVSGELRDRLGIAVARQAYRAYRALLDSPRWLRLANEGARAQRLLWASTSVKDPAAPDVLYVGALAAPFTVDTMPDHTLEAFADHGIVGDLLPADGGDADQAIAAFAQAGIDAEALAGELQRQGAEAFMASWQDLLARIDARHEQLSR